MNADDWVITVASVSAAVFAAIAAWQGRDKRQRELERDDVVWDVPQMVRPEVVVRLEEGQTIEDVVVRADWYGDTATVRRASMRRGDEVRIATPGLTPPESHFDAAMGMAKDVTVGIDWRTPQGAPRHKQIFTGWSLD